MQLCTRGCKLVEIVCRQVAQAAAGEADLVREAGSFFALDIERFFGLTVGAVFGRLRAILRRWPFLPDFGIGV